MRRTAAAEAIAADKPPSAANPTANAPPTTAAPMRISVTPGPGFSEPAGGGPASAGGVGGCSFGAPADLPAPGPAAAAADGGTTPGNRREKRKKGWGKNFF